MPRNVIPLCLLAVLTLSGAIANAADDEKMPTYEHILVIILENHSFEQIVDGDDAPNIKRLAKEFGIATNFYGEIHPSEGNYVAMIGGDTFGIQDDDAWYCRRGLIDTPKKPIRNCPGLSTKDPYVNHTIEARSLVDQLEEHRPNKLTWKGYFQNIPDLGSKAHHYPDEESLNDHQPVGLYASKHNGFINFMTVQGDAALESKLVGFDQLEDDLKRGDLPSYAHIVPNQCDDMHGLTGPKVPYDCLFENRKGLIMRGDKMVNDLVEKIRASKIWGASSNTAIVITWDEDHAPEYKIGRQGCCSCAYSSSKANFGGGHIPTLVITNHRHPNAPHEDPTPYNHYSLLRTTEEAFGIDEYLGHANESGCGVKAMTPLFRVK